MKLLTFLITKNGRVIERCFVGLFDVSNDRSAHFIAQEVLNVLETFDCVDKLIAQTYDGAAVMASDLNGVQARIKERVPSSIFVHCLAHSLNLVLVSGIKDIRECNIFFSTLSGLASFFSKSTKSLMFSKFSSPKPFRPTKIQTSMIMRSFCSKTRACLMQSQLSTDSLSYACEL